MSGDADDLLLAGPEDVVSSPRAEDGEGAVESSDPFEPPAGHGEDGAVDAARERLFSSLEADPR